MIRRLNIGYLLVTQPLALLFVVGSVATVNAQKFTLGVKAEGSLTWAGFGDKEAKDTFSSRMKPGFGASLLIGFPLKEAYDLMLEGGLSQSGRIITFNSNPEWRNNLTMRTVDMGMVLRRNFDFMLRKDTPARAFVGIGPEISYWMHSQGFIAITDGPKYEYDTAFGNDSDSDVAGGYVLMLQDVNRWLFSLNFGAGVKAPLRNNRFITTELRFSSGHTFLGKENSAFMERFLWGPGSMQDTMKTNMKTVSLSVAYTIDVDIKESRKGKSTIKKKLKR